MFERAMTIPVNYNGKMANDYFLHIAPWPSVEPKEEYLKNLEVILSVKDNSHQPVRLKIVRFEKFKTKDLTNLHTLSSHGMDVVEFLHWLLVVGKVIVTKETELIIYYFRKVNVREKIF